MEDKMIKYPKFLQQNDTIGITAPSDGIIKEFDKIRFDLACKKLNSLGYKTIKTDNVEKSSKLVSSSSQERAEQFRNLWSGNDVSMILAVSGGEFLMDMLPYLDVESIKSSVPKWIQGYSDISLLNFYLTTNFNIATSTSVNAKSFGMNPWHKSLENNIEILKGNEIVQESFDMYQGEWSEDILGNEDAGFNLTDKVEYKNLYGKSQEKFEGRIIGGCIDVIKTLMGTKFDNTKNFVNSFNEGVIWCIENCEMSVADLYRALWQMKQSGWFENTNGVLVGRTFSSKDMKDFTYLDVLHKIFDDINVPVVYDIDFGHLAPQWTIINGSYAEFEYENGKGKLLQRMI
ncbi:MAG: LD-carboxypeptidase [Clostridiales bacterium]|nr:LD-carboxypeptidase [Clostridiales bacterium]